MSECKCGFYGKYTRSKNVISGKKLMGNVSTILLQYGPIDRIQKRLKNFLDCGIDILAPACGLSAKNSRRAYKGDDSSSKKRLKCTISDLRFKTITMSQKIEIIFYPIKISGRVPKGLPSLKRQGCLAFL